GTRATPARPPPVLPLPRRFSDWARRPPRTPVRWGFRRGADGTPREDTTMSRLSRGLSGLSSNGGTGSRMGMSQTGLERQSNKSFEELKRLIHSKLVDKLDLSRVSDLEGDTRRPESA